MRFTRDHLWIEPEGGEARVGITAYGAQALGDVFRLSLPSAGAVVAAGEPLGQVEAVNATRSLSAPASGEVLGANADLLDSPDLLGAGPETLGWLVRLRLSDPAELDGLMDRAAYEAFLDGL